MSKQKCFPWLFFFYPSLWAFSQALQSLPLTHIPNLTFYFTNHYLNSWSRRCILQPELFFQNQKPNYRAHQWLLFTLKIQTSPHANRNLHYLFCACVNDPLWPQWPRILRPQGRVLPLFFLSSQQEGFCSERPSPAISEWVCSSQPSPALHWLIRDGPPFTALSEFSFLISQMNHWMAMLTNLKSKPLPVILVKYH